MEQRKLEWKRDGRIMLWALFISMTALVDKIHLLSQDVENCKSAILDIFVKLCEGLSSHICQIILLFYGCKQ